MDDRATDFALRVLGVLLTAAGLVAVLLGYLGVRNHNDVVLQVPYFMSGGVGGLALLGLGALTLVQQQMRAQARRFDEITESLEEWKETALAEIRGFLEGAEIEVEVIEPSVRQVRRTNGVPPTARSSSAARPRSPLADASGDGSRRATGRSK